MSQEIKIIKYTLPEEYYTESGELKYSYNCVFLEPIIENDNYLFTVQPFLQIHIDGKLYGEMRCESNYFIDKNFKGDILLKEIFECLEKNANDFNSKIAEQKILLPKNFIFKNPPVEGRKDFFMSMFNNVS